MSTHNASNNADKVHIPMLILAGYVFSAPADAGRGEAGPHHRGALP